ncbi:hypothetical protein DND58_18425 [Pseudomonas syringae pv. pisi]|nr:hypothetical protein DND62_16990 [Pseudomonas syringae pv. pisi]PYD28549.1 hypothetical protein DND67_18465 [Pseudomonas syringae pv. pisi]PYD29976.1 hypothetical protein DND58_18425 [Pseudomonas syringae pv. pisi]
MTGNADRERSNQLTCVAGFCFASDVYATPDQHHDSAVTYVALCVVSTIAVEQHCIGGRCGQRVRLCRIRVT